MVGRLPDFVDVQGHWCVAVAEPWPATETLIEVLAPEIVDEISVGGRQLAILEEDAGARPGLQPRGGPVAVCPYGQKSDLRFRTVGLGPLGIPTQRITDACPKVAYSDMVQPGARWCNIADMAETERSVRQSVSIPTGIARRVRALAKTRKTSANRVLVDLIEAGLQSKEAEKERFVLLVNRLTESPDSAERQRLKEELARMTFGD